MQRAVQTRGLRRVERDRGVDQQRADARAGRCPCPGSRPGRAGSPARVAAARRRVVSICLRKCFLRPLRTCQTPDADEDQPGGPDEELPARPAEDAGRGLLLRLRSWTVRSPVAKRIASTASGDVDDRLDQRVAGLPQRLRARLARGRPAAAPAQHLGRLPDGQRDQPDREHPQQRLADRRLGERWPSRRTGRPTPRRRRTRPAAGPARRRAGARRRRRSARPGPGARGRRCCRPVGRAHRGAVVLCAHERLLRRRTDSGSASHSDAVAAPAGSRGAGEGHWPRGERRNRHPDGAGGDSRGGPADLAAVAGPRPRA